MAQKDLVPGNPSQKHDYSVERRTGLTRVLIVEDEMVVAMLIEDMVSELGYEVSGVASQVDEAISQVERGGFDLAILDVHLNGKQVFPLADLLLQKDIPFMFATAYGERGIPAVYRQRPVLQKPFSPLELKKALLELRQNS